MCQKQLAYTAYSYSSLGDGGRRVRVSPNATTYPGLGRFWEGGEQCLFCPNIHPVTCIWEGGRRKIMDEEENRYRLTFKPSYYLWGGGPSCGGVD